MSTKAALDLLHSSKKYDLIITEVFNTDCFLGFVYKFKVPYIAVSAAHIIPTAAERFGIPDNPSYIPNAFLSYDSDMNFVQRMFNAITTLSINLMRKYYYDPKHHKVATKYFGEDLPPLDQLARNTSLVLVNSHFTFMGSRPYPNNVIEVAGLHVKSPQPLPNVSSKYRCRECRQHDTSRVTLRLDPVYIVRTYRLKSSHLSYTHQVKCKPYT